jgi:hypothetical protein
MTKADKREQKIRQNTKNVSLEDFEWLICRYGYIKAGGRHQEAILDNESYPYPRTNPIRQCYVKRLIEDIDRRGSDGEKP